jgi:heme A synthase
LNVLPLVVIAQVGLGILTVLGAYGQVPVVPGVLHQGFGVLLFGCVVVLVQNDSRGYAA